MKLLNRQNAFLVHRQIAAEPMITDPVDKSLTFAIFGLRFIVSALPYVPLSELADYL